MTSSSAGIAGHRLATKSTKSTKNSRKTLVVLVLFVANLSRRYAAPLTRPGSGQVRSQLVRKSLEVAGAERAGLGLFLAAVERDLLLRPQQHRVLADRDFHLAGADEAAGLPALGGHDEVGAA